MNNFIGTKQVAAMLGVNLSTLTRAVWDGRIMEPQRGPGGCYIWSDADIHRAAREFNVKLTEGMTCA